MPRCARTGDAREPCDGTEAEPGEPVHRDRTDRDERLRVVGSQPGEKRTCNDRRALHTDAPERDHERGEERCECGDPNSACRDGRLKEPVVG